MGDSKSRVGVVIPQVELGASPAEVKDFAQGVEALGFSHVIAYDHVIGADLKNRPDWKMPYHVDSPFHEPFTLFSFLSGVTTSLGFTTGVIILPQRQTVLVAKQAANVDVFSGGRLRLGVGVGWNDVEYASLGRSFKTRGRKLDEQIPLLRRLWMERSLSDRGEDHDIDEAGICPPPVQQPIPIWVGGMSKAAMKRAANLGDGWLPFLPSHLAEGLVSQFHDEIRAAGRRPEDVPLENIIFAAPYGGTRRTPEGILADATIWRTAGASAVSVDTMNMDLKGANQHLEFLAEVASALDLV